MVIAHQTSSSNGVGSTSVTPGTASGMATGDACLVVLPTKPGTSAITLPAGWQTVGQNQGGAGTNGAGTGPTRVGVFFREKTAAWSTPPSFTVTSGNSSAAASYRFSKDTETYWSHENRNATYNSAAADTSLGPINESLDLVPGDWVMVAISNQDDAPTWSGQSITATGFTFSAITEFADNIGTTTGNDVGGAFWGAEVLTGSGTAALAVSATASAASTGAVVIFRLGERLRVRRYVGNRAAILRGSTY